jgi:NAD(P)-dependent dehydrogenase (short-subunit alcohol dehydrogenase family)
VSADESLAGVVAVVTGAGSGLGAATARELVARGASVGLLDRDADAVTAVAEELGDATTACVADVTDTDAVIAVLERLRATAGPLRLAVCCHGILRGGRTVGARGAARLDDFRAVVEVNLIATFNVMRLAAAAMADNEPDTDGARGAVILTASIAAFEGQVGQTAYAASKAGVVGLTLPAARDLASLGIRVCTIAPGTFDTPMMAGLPETVREALGRQIPFPPRLGRPGEFAALVCHIATNPAINGETVRLDGALRLPPR